METRRATPADIPALRDLCVASVGPDDYVLRFLPRFTAESTTYLAEEGGRAIGMVVYDDTPDGGAWLHAGRTHPDYRRRGVATTLTRRCEQFAGTRGRTSLRLWAAASNVASVSASRRQGYLERARFTRMRVASAPPGPAVPLEPLVQIRDWRALASSSILQMSAGYVFHDFYFLPLNVRTLPLLSDLGALWRLGDSGVEISGDLEEATGVSLQIQPLFGDPSVVLAAAPGIGRDRGADRVESFLPHVPEILDAARRAGYESMEWGQEAILFEKLLPATSSSPDRSA